MNQITSFFAHRQVYATKNIISFSESIHVELNDRQIALTSILLEATKLNNITYSHDTLALRLNCCRKTVIRDMKYLESLGLVSWKHRYNKTNLYTVTEDIKTEQNIIRARNYLKYFFALALALLMPQTIPKDATQANVPVKLNGLYKNINHSTKKIVEGENYSLLLDTDPSWVHPPGLEFIRKRAEKRKEFTMSFKDPHLSGKKAPWQPDHIPLESHQVLASRKETVVLAQEKLIPEARFLWDIVQGNWLDQDPTLLGQSNVILK